MNNSVFGKTMQNVRKHRNIKLVTSDKRGSYLVPKANYNRTKWFPENLLATEINRIRVKINKSI